MRFCGACLSGTTTASRRELRLTNELPIMCVFGNAGCVSRMSLRSYTLMPMARKKKAAKKTTKAAAKPKAARKTKRK